MDILTEVKRALKFVEEKQYIKAEKIYRSILDKDKDNAVVLSLLGFLYLTVCLYEKADKCFEKSYKIQPNPATVEGLGLVKFALNDKKNAYKYLSEAIKTTQRFDVYDKYIEVLSDGKYFQEAYNYAKECYEKFPLRKEALYNLASTSLHAGFLIEAQSLAEQLVKKYPNYGAGWHVYGLLFEVLYQDDIKACECYKQIIKCGNKSLGYYNLAVSYSRSGDLKKSLYYIRKYIQVENYDAASLFLIASYYFRLRKFKLGYKYYSQKESRRTKKDMVSKLKNIWDGKSHKDKTLLVYCDQGLGDHIMFSRFLPQLKNKFKRVKVYIPGRLVKIMKRSFKEYNNIEFLPFKERLPRYDMSVVFSNLPYYLKTDINTIPFSQGYLKADDKKVMEYKEKYFQTDKLKVGVCWEAGAAGIRDLINRTLNISLFAPLFDVPNVEFCSMQVNPAMDNYKEYPLTDLGSTFKSFDDTAAALKNLDLLVTVDTSVLHMAGALGVKTFMFLPYTYDWRWFDGRETTEWYDSVRIFKQTKRMDWSNVIEDMACEIKKIVKNNKNV